MKDTIISLLQQRMDKCTREQVWAVAALTAADGFLATHVADIASKIPSCILLFAMTAATAWGIFIIVDRHFAYYKNRAALASLLEGEPDVPRLFKASWQSSR
jgi:hypothetical protein